MAGVEPGPGAGIPNRTQTERPVIFEHRDTSGLNRGGMEKLLTLEEVAELLRVLPSWVYDRTRLRSSARIPGFRLGKYWRFRESDVLAWLERQRTGAKPNA